MQNNYKILQLYYQRNLDKGCQSNQRGDYDDESRDKDINGTAGRCTGLQERDCDQICIEGCVILRDICNTMWSRELYWDAYVC